MANGVMNNNSVLEKRITGTTTATGTGNLGMDFLVSENKVLNVIINNTDRLDIHLRQDNDRYYFILTEWLTSTTALTNYSYDLTVLYVIR